MLEKGECGDMQEELAISHAAREKSTKWFGCQIIVGGEIVNYLGQDNSWRLYRWAFNFCLWLQLDLDNLMH